MKKIMIAAAIVCAAVMTQAASIKWSVSAAPTASGKVLAYNGSSTYQQATYIILASDESSIAAKLAKGETDFTALGSATSANSSSGMIAAQTLTSDKLSTSSTAFKLLLIDNNYGGTGEYAYKFSDSVTATPSGDPSKPTAVTFTATGKINNQSWSTYSVPEPTSGLLLLLGVAGMALRRRRA